MNTGSIRLPGGACQDFDFHRTKPANGTPSIRDRRAVSRSRRELRLIQTRIYADLRPNYIPRMRPFSNFLDQPQLFKFFQPPDHCGF